jgi:hypothetical protein
MTVDVTKNGYAMFLVGTSKSEILTSIVNNHYPAIKAMFFNAADSKYHIIVENR